MENLDFVPSQEQELIYEFFRSGEGNAVVRARAGSGKTSTILKAINYAPERRILLAAFNKRIADELQKNLSNPNATAKTLHAIGYGFVRRWWNVPLEEKGSGNRKNDLAVRACGENTPEVILRLVAKLHTLAREIAPYATRVGDLTEILYDHECEPDETWHHQGYDAYYVEDKAIRAMVLAAARKPIETGIDFADMIFLPLRNKWLVASYDLGVVDEAQDMTLAQLDVFLGVCKGRIVVVGDDRQAIYAFRGADSNSLDRLKQQLRARELKLTTTFRCGRLITEFAKVVVPDINSWEKSPDGEIIAATTEEFMKTVDMGDFVLSRFNAPLVATAMSLWKSGKRAKIAGKDVGAGLKTLVKKLSKGNPTVEQFIERLDVWTTREIAKWSAKNREDRINQVRDKSEMIMNLSEDAVMVADINTRIDELFTDYGLGDAGVITCSSVHRAKGLEANTVYILWDTIKANKIEEENIKYVAITRAKRKLVLVHPTSVVKKEGGGLGSSLTGVPDYFLCSPQERVALWAEAERFGRDS